MILFYASWVNFKLKGLACWREGVLLHILEYISFYVFGSVLFPLIPIFSASLDFQKR